MRSQDDQGGDPRYPSYIKKEEEEYISSSGTENRGTPLPPSSSGTVGGTDGVRTPSTLVQAMAEAGVLTLSPAKQRAVADALSKFGVSADDVRLLAQFVQQNEQDKAKARRYLATVLADPAQACESVAQVTKYVKANPDKDDKDYEYGSKERQGALERSRKIDEEWETWRNQCKLEGRWPPSKTRAPHPWENGVVKPPVMEDEAKRRKTPEEVKLDRLGHLVAWAKLYIEYKRDIPGHVVREIMQLHTLWKGFDIPAPIVEAHRRLNRRG